MYEDRGRGYFDESDLKRQSAFSRSLAGVFALMFLGLVVSALTALYTLSSEGMIDFLYYTSYGMWVFLIAELLLVMIAFPRIWRMSAGAGVALFFLYAVLNGVTLSVIFLAYDIGTITLAFLSAAGMFAVMAVYGAVTRADLSRARSILFMGLIGLIIASLVNFFLASSYLDTIICYAGIAVFVALTAYDIQRIKRAMAEMGDAPVSGLMVMGALHLYLDFINIFLYLLRLLGRRR